MNITWPDHNNQPVTGRIDANVHPYIEVLGLDNAAMFLLNMGGRALQMPRLRPKSGTALAVEMEQLFGDEWKQKTIQLARKLNMATARIPVATGFFVRYLCSKGWSISDISSRLRISDVTTRKYLKSEHELRSVDLPQSVSKMKVQ